MNVSLLDFPKIHPPIHTPRFSVRFRTQGSNTPQVGSFKNPFIGIEINLLKEIQDIESVHKPTSKHKKTALLNALEDTANFDYGFKNQILYALSMLRPPEVDEESNEVFRMTSAKDLLNTEREYSQVDIKKNTIDKRISKLKEKLDLVESQERQMKDDIEKMKDKLMNQNHRFEEFRTVRDKITVLQATFDKILSHADDDQTDPRIAELLKENHNLQKRIMKLKYELFTVNQISRRLQFLEEDEN